MLYRVHLVWERFELKTLVVIGTDCIGSYKSNYHTIMTMTTPSTDREILVVIKTFWLVPSHFFTANNITLFKNMKKKIIFLANEYN